MEENEGKTPLEILIGALSERDMEYVIDEKNNSLIVMDADGNPHECWDGVDMVNVCVPMTVEDTVKYLRSTFRGLERGIIMMQKRENDKLQDENAKLRELARDMYCLAYPSAVGWEVSDAAYDKYSPCERCKELHGGKAPCASTSDDMTEECCKPIQATVVADRMRELEIEVNK